MFNLNYSEAKVKNANIHAEDQDEPLVQVLKADGTRSEWFPADLRSLFSYDGELSVVGVVHTQVTCRIQMTLWRHWRETTTSWKTLP